MRADNSTKRCRVGRHRNTRDHAVVLGARCNGSPAFAGAIRRCLRIGRWYSEVPLWSRMSGDAHARFCKRLGVELPGPTRPSMTTGNIICSRHG